MTHVRQAQLSSARWMVTALLSVALAGCQQSASGPETAKTSDSREERTASAASTSDQAQQLLDQLVRTYQEARSYEDAGELLLVVQNQDGQRDESPPIPFSVTFERPNKVRIHSLDANLVSDGERIQATINSLEGQVLTVAAPARLTPGDIVADRMLIAAMRGQIDAQLPQLALLLEPDPIKKLVGSAQPVMLEDATFGGEKCHRVAFDSPQGQTVFWISPQSHLLVKCEFPSNEFREKFSLAKAALWCEMKGARIDKPIVADAFKMEVPSGAKLLKRFLEPPPAAPSAALGKTVDDFKLLDYRGGNVTRESLKGKVVVLDMWATWCGWCFRGFPNLQQVYDEFKANDNVVILAVNKDDPSVTDAEVKQKFVDSNLTIPIVRDQQQITDAVFQVPGLPTMVILGPEGTMEDHHIGYDENLAKTLPEKLNKLLAGESLAKAQIERYNEARQKYEQQLADALVNP